MLHESFVGGASGFIRQLLTASATQVGVWTFNHRLHVLLRLEIHSDKITGISLLFVSRALPRRSEGAVRAFSMRKVV